MSPSCAPFRPLLDGLADGEIDPARVEPHLRACADCRAELEAVRALKARLSRLRFPDVPRSSPARRPAVYAAAAAALLAVVALLLATPPPLHARSAGLHEDVLSGRLVLSDLGISPAATRADYGDGCPCPPSLGDASPFVLIRHEGGFVSVLAFETDESGPAFVRRVGANTVLREARDGLGLIWVSRLEEASLRRAVERWRPAAGASLRAFTCACCCALLEGRADRIDGPVSMELVTGLDRGALRPAAR